MATHEQRIKDLEAEIAALTRENRELRGQGGPLPAGETGRGVDEAINHYWQAVLNHCRLLVTVTDPEGVLYEWNKASENVLGWKREEVVGSREVWRRMYPDPAAFQRMGELYRQVVLGERPGDDLTMDAVTRTGEVRTLSMFFTVIKDARGHPFRIVKLAMDVTDKKRAEGSLSKRNAQLAGILEHSPSSIHLLDAQGRFLLVNRRFEELYGLSRENARDRTPGQVFSPSTAEIFTRGDQEVLHTGRTCRLTETMPIAGDPRVFEGVKFPFFDADGAIIGLCAIATDVTEDKRLQAETLRAGQLASLGELAAGVAHEINNPITGMINYAQLLLDGSMEREEGADICRRIIKEGRRIADIVRNLLSFAREGDREQGLFNFSDALLHALDLTRSQLKKDGIALCLHLDDDLPPLWGREREIQQVILNLASNSRYALNLRHSRSGRDKKLTVTACAKETPEGRRLRLEFLDNGTGIPGALLGRICDPFFSTKPEGQGTGLGLSITYGIVKDHGGSLSFESREGEYTRVVVELPAAAVTTGADPN